MPSERSERQRVKVVIDTVIFIRALINPRGYNSEIVRRIDEFELFISEDILKELLDVLYRSNLKKKYDPSGNITISDILNILSEATIITPSQKIEICRDPHDNKFIECAIAAGANYIISGDEDLLNIKEYGNVKIIRIDTFLKILDSLSANQSIEFEK